MTAITTNNRLTVAEVGDKKSVGPAVDGYLVTLIQSNQKMCDTVDESANF